MNIIVVLFHCLFSPFLLLSTSFVPISLFSLYCYELLLPKKEGGDPLFAAMDANTLHLKCPLAELQYAFSTVVYKFIVCAMRKDLADWMVLAEPVSRGDSTLASLFMRRMRQQRECDEAVGTSYCPILS